MATENIRLPEDEVSWAYRNSEEELRFDRYSAHRVARDGEVRAIEFFLLTSHFSLRNRDSFLGYPIHYAIFFNRFDILKKLLASGADTEALSPLDGLGIPDNALRFAARQDRTKCVEILWRFGLKQLPEASKGEARYSALEVAAFYGHHDVVKKLLELWDGWPPERIESAVWLAAQAYQVEAVGLLVDTGKCSKPALGRALYSATSTRNWILLGTFKQSPLSDDRSETLRQCRVLEKLLDAGADPNHTVNGHVCFHSLLHIKAMNETLRLLLQRGANPNAIDIRAGTALHQLASYGVRPGHKADPYEDLVVNGQGMKILVEYGASWDIRDSQCRKPMECARQSCDPELVAACIEAGAPAVLKVDSPSQEVDS